ncbi:anion permease [Haloimpatiens sp. FM7315]|uniref:inorganic phosphate transporter n=1 Tax=Haloimpatiens sp. FM7315 TaxID=3298609 RepID=UPI0035A34F35
MLNYTLIVTVIIIVFSLIFDFINGFHDTANAIATSVSTKVLTLKEAIIMSATLNLIGAFISVKVAKTIGADIVDPKLISQMVIIAALVAAIIWNLITWYFGIPNSSSHALIGGLLGASIIYKSSFLIINWHSFITKVVLWLFLSPLIGFIIGYFIMILLYWILRSAKPRSVSKFFSKAQIASAAFMAFNHGANDAQKSMGIITMTLLSGGFITYFHIPIWVKICCAFAMALGTCTGGRRIIKTMGINMARLAPVNGFAAETGAAIVIFIATMLRAPVSTTHIISTSIMGVGAAKRLSSVKWGVARSIVWAWILTIPVCMILSGIIMFIFKLV